LVGEAARKALAELVLSQPRRTVLSHMLDITGLNMTSEHRRHNQYLQV